MQSYPRFFMKEMKSDLFFYAYVLSQTWDLMEWERMVFQFLYHSQY